MAVTLEHRYGTRGKTRAIDQRLERLEQMQKEMQDQLQARMQEQLAKIQQDMRDHMLESQKSMMDQLTRLLAGGLEKGISPLINAKEDNEDPTYPPGFAPADAQTQPDMYPRRPSVTIRPQPFQAGASAPMNYQAGSGSNLGDNPTNPVVLNLDEVIEAETTRVELPRELEERCRWLEEKFKEMESTDYRGGIDAKELSLVPDLFVNVTFIIEGNKIPMPRLSETTRMGLRLTVGKGALPGRGLGRYLQGRINVPMMKDKQDRFGLGFKPDMKQRKKELEKKQERRRARLSGGEIEWEPMIFPHISKTFVSGGVIHSEQKTSGKEILEGMMESLDINATYEEGTGVENLSGIRPYEPGSVLNNWTAEEILVVFRTNSE
ncbi:hypothetical protein PVK06_008340 [Gossypium arboreum]|uniref:G-patch domain-containing protein n=1 Tax=Gossypium arboreum TaxID=29729 RepID=A0ABR0QKJ4_GOSAR|nr:hypothetical protein PVK06_008340 [Gossypium arboreum]